MTENLHIKQLIENNKNIPAKLIESNTASILSQLSICYDTIKAIIIYELSISMIDEELLEEINLNETNISVAVKRIKQINKVTSEDRDQYLPLVMVYRRAHFKEHVYEGTPLLGALKNSILLCSYEL